jgi:glycosyltransferase involved in cell wall biosynthesis
MSSARLLVLLPAYNEARAIADVVRGVLRHLPHVLVIDDGSTDDTAARAGEAGAEVIRLHPNQGKGVALEQGFAYALAQGYDAVVTMDSDGQHSPEDLPRFVEAFAEARYPVLIGNRMTSTSQMPTVRKWTNRLMSFLLSRVMGQSVPDTQNGYRLYHMAAIQDVTIDSARFAAESEILLHAATRGIRIGSVPVRTIYGDEQSKINPVKDTFRFLRMLMRFRREMRRSRT